MISPAASAFLTIGNARSNEDDLGDLVGPTVELVRSPVVVAMWREQAMALGWPEKPIGWADLVVYARDPAAWAKAAGEGGPVQDRAPNPTSPAAGSRPSSPWPTPTRASSPSA